MSRLDLSFVEFAAGARPTLNHDDVAQARVARKALSRFLMEYRGL